MKKFVLIFVILILTLLFQPKKSDNVVRFATWGSQSEIEIIKPLIEEFEEKNPTIKVELMHIPQNYFQKIHLLFASKMAPDVVFMNNHYLPYFAKANVLKPVKYNTEEYNKKAVEALSYNGQTYAVPRDISLLVIFRNREIFKKCGVPLKGDLNFDEFLTVTKNLSSCKAFGKRIYGISFEEEPALFYLPYLMSEGGEIISPDGKFIFNEANSQKGLKFYADLRNKYHVAPTKSESANLTAAQMFLNGSLAMHLSGHWLVPKYTKEAKFDFDAITFPKGQQGSITPLDASGWALSKDASSEAEELVKFLSSKQSIEKINSCNLVIPARLDVFEEAFLSSDKNASINAVFAKALKTSKPTSVTPNYNEVLNDLKKIVEPLFNVSQ